MRHLVRNNPRPNVARMKDDPAGVEFSLPLPAYPDRPPPRVNSGLSIRVPGLLVGVVGRCPVLHGRLRGKDPHLKIRCPGFQGPDAKADYSTRHHTHV